MAETYLHLLHSELAAEVDKDLNVVLREDDEFYGRCAAAVIDHRDMGILAQAYIDIVTHVTTESHPIDEKQIAVVLTKTQWNAVLRYVDDASDAFSQIINKSNDWDTAQSMLSNLAFLNGIWDELMSQIHPELR